MAKYNITSASQYIDLTTITNGCNQIEAAAEKFAESAKKIYSSSDICSEKALAVDKTTMQPQLDADAQYVESIRKAIRDFTLEVKNVALQVRAEQERELSEYEAAKRAAANNQNTN